MPLEEQGGEERLEEHGSVTLGQTPSPARTWGESPLLNYAPPVPQLL